MGGVGVGGERMVWAQTVKRLPTMWKTQVRSLGGEDPLEKEMATHSSTHAWKIPWMKERGRLQSMGCKGSDMTEQLHFLSHFKSITFILNFILLFYLISSSLDPGGWRWLL